MKVAAVVVTYNRTVLLLETLRGIALQQPGPAHVFIVDNASDEDVRSALAEAGYLDDERYSYVRLDENTGGAGGFNKGLELAYDAGYDWFWTLDDDVEPEPDALSRLLSYTDISECINSRKVFEGSDEVQQWEQVFDFTTGRLIDLHNVSFANGKRWCAVNVACFEGMLVSRRVLEAVGLPRKAYFIYHDDTLFGILANMHTNVIYVSDAVLRKKIYGYGDATPFRAYYFIRNMFWLRKDVFASADLGEVPKNSTVLFGIYVLFMCFVMLRDGFGLSMIASLFRGVRDGIFRSTPEQSPLAGAAAPKSRAEGA